MAKRIKKTAGRPPAAANKKSNFVRDQECKIRCTEGFNKVLDMLVASPLYKSKADVLHEALQRLAYSKDVEAEHWNYWRGKIQ